MSSIKITFPGGGAKELADRNVPENPESYPEYKMFGVLPAYGFYCRHVDGLVFNDVDVKVSETDHRPALVCDDVRNLRVNGYGAMSAPGGAVMTLNDVRGALVQGCSAQANTGVFLRLQGDSQAVTVTGNDLSRARVPFDVSAAVRGKQLYESGNRLKR